MARQPWLRRAVCRRHLLVPHDLEHVVERREAGLGDLALEFSCPSVGGAFGRPLLFILDTAGREVVERQQPNLDVVLCCVEARFFRWLSRRYRAALFTCQSSGLKSVMTL